MGGGCAAKNKGYADKPETIAISAIAEIRSHTLEKVYENRVDRMTYCEARLGTIALHNKNFISFFKFTV